MNVNKRLNDIEKAIQPAGIPEAERLQIIEGNNINGQFVPADSTDTMENRKAGLIAKYGTVHDVTFVSLIDRFEAAG